MLHSDTFEVLSSTPCSNTQVPAAELSEKASVSLSIVTGLSSSEPTRVTVPCETKGSGSSLIHSHNAHMPSLACQVQQVHSAYCSSSPVLDTQP